MLIPGPRNSQVSKLWATAHWKEESCVQYWKDKHVLCVRKYRKSKPFPLHQAFRLHEANHVSVADSAYAKDEEVIALLGSQFPDIANRFLHKLAKKMASPNEQKRQPFGARRASSVTLNSVSTAHSLATTKTPESVKTSFSKGNTALKEEASPSQVG
jgi:hypothetical protein